MDPSNLYYIVGGVFVFIIGLDVLLWTRGRKFKSPEVARMLRSRSVVRTLFIAGLALLFSSVCFHVNIFSYRKPVPFEQIKSITFKDFTGFKRPFETLDGMSEFAFITTKINWRRNHDSIEVEALFYPARSYVFNNSADDRLLLNHELYHFRITEYAARVIRKEIAAATGSISDKEIREIFDRNVDKADAMQTAYDEESYHGYVLKRQKKWEMEIDSLLSLHREFESTKIPLSPR